MAISVDGQYYYRFNIGGFEDFIDNDDFDSFTLIEEAGNMLPTWKISFKTSDPDVPKVWNEGNDLEVSYGIDQDNLVDAKLLITKSTISGAGDQKYQITGLGIYSAINYITKAKTLISDKKSGVAIVKDVAAKHFLCDFNIDVSEDSQYWIQPNITDKKYIDNVCLHSYLSKSFIGTGITSDGTFRLLDISQVISEPYAFKFTNTSEEDGKDISYSSNPELISNSGFINCWVGYGREKPVYTIEDDSLNKYLETSEPLMVLSNTFARNSSVEKRNAAIGMENDNTHSKYWQAALKNVQGLSLFSSQNLTLTYDSFNTIKVFDLVMFKKGLLDNDNEASEYESGLYLVGLVSRTVSANKFSTTVSLFREGMSSITGSLK